MRLDKPGAPDKSGQPGLSIRARCLLEEKIGRIQPEEWRPNPIPWQLLHVWIWFLELNQARRAREPIGYADIYAWAQLTRCNITPAEVGIIRQLDNLWFKVQFGPEQAQEALNPKNVAAGLRQMMDKKQKRPPPVKVL